MKAVSVQQPWATLIVSGAKRIETRSWQTRHRGPLAVHASSRFPPAARLLCGRSPWCQLLAQAGFDGWAALPVGRVLGLVDLVDCLPVAALDAAQAADLEVTPGDHRRGNWAWLLAYPAP